MTYYETYAQEDKIDTKEKSHKGCSGREIVIPGTEKERL